MSLFDWLRGKKKSSREPASEPPRPPKEAPKQAPQQQAPRQADQAPRQAAKQRAAPSSAASKETSRGPKRPLLYFFQFISLPKAVFTNDSKLIAELETGSVFFPLMHIRTKASMECARASVRNPDLAPPDMQTEEELFEAVAIHSYRRSGYAVHVVTMPTPESAPEAFFAAIVYKDGEPKHFMQASPSTRYLTLEMNPAGRPMFCELRPDGSRRNYGERQTSDLPAFVEAVFERIVEKRPSGNRVPLPDFFQSVMMFATPSSTDYHFVTVEFKDGTKLPEVKLYCGLELELPPEHIGKEINLVGMNQRQP